MDQLEELLVLCGEVRLEEALLGQEDAALLFASDAPSGVSGYLCGICGDFLHTGQRKRLHVFKHLDDVSGDVLGFGPVGPDVLPGRRMVVISSPSCGGRAPAGLLT